MRVEVYTNFESIFDAGLLALARQHLTANAEAEHLVADDVVLVDRVGLWHQCHGCKTMLKVKALFLLCAGIRPWLLFY